MLKYTYFTGIPIIRWSDYPSQRHDTKSILDTRYAVQIDKYQFTGDFYQRPDEWPCYVPIWTFCTYMANLTHFWRLRRNEVDERLVFSFDNYLQLAIQLGQHRNHTTQLLLPQRAPYLTFTHSLTTHTSHTLSHTTNIPTHTPPIHYTHTHHTRLTHTLLHTLHQQQHGTLYLYVCGYG